MGKADGNHRALLNNSKISRVLDPWTHPQESFGYDDLDRLVFVKSGAAETMKISYAPNGNILFKTGVENFSYDKNVRPHAVTEVENTDGKIPENGVTREFYYLISHHKFI